MPYSHQSILTVYSEVQDAVFQLVRHRERVLHEREIAIYDRCMERLRQVGMDVGEYELSPDLYLGVGPNAPGFSGGSHDRRVGYRDFDARAAMLLGTLRRSIKQLQEESERMRRMPADLIENRKALLSLLIDAFIESRERIAIGHGDGGIRLAKVDTRKMGFPPTMADLEALRDQGLISIQPGPSKATLGYVTIPTSTLNLAGDPAALGDAVAGTNRQEATQRQAAFNNFFYGNVGNVATNSRDFHQTSVVIDLESVIERVRELQGSMLTEDGVNTLVRAIESDAQHSGKPVLGDQVLRWISDVSSGTVAGMLTAELSQAIPAVMGVFASLS